MIRHYEKLGMVPAAVRRASGYRDYGDGDVARLRFIARARGLGVPLDEIAELLAADDLATPGLADRWRRLLDSKAEDLKALRLDLDLLAGADRAGV